MANALDMATAWLLPLWRTPTCRMLPEVFFPPLPPDAFKAAWASLLAFALLTTTSFWSFLVTLTPTVRAAESTTAGTWRILQLLEPSLAPRLLLLAVGLSPTCRGGQVRVRREGGGRVHGEKERRPPCRRARRGSGLASVGSALVDRKSAPTLSLRERVRGDPPPEVREPHQCEGHGAY